MSRPMFGDLYKPVNGVLEDNYLGSNSVVSVKTATPDNLRFQVKGKRKETGVIDGSLEWAQDFVRNNISYNAKGKIDNSGVVVTSINGKSFANGLDLGLETRFETEKAAQQAVGSLNYRRGNATLKTELTVKSDRTAALLASSTITKNNLSLGAQFKTAIVPQPKTIDKYDLSLRYSTGNNHLVAQLEDNISVAKLGYAHTLADGVIVAGQLKHDLKSDSSRPVFTVGLSKVYAEKPCNLRAKVSSEGSFGVSYKMNVAKDVVSVASVEGNLNTLNKNTSKVGVEFTYLPKQ